jgi:thiol-disulfide isomerase/thioredoxin
MILLNIERVKNMKSSIKMCAIVFLLSTFYAVFPMRIATAKSVETIQPVAIAPLFSSRTIQGGQVSNQKLIGKGYIINFFATWCPYCRREIPDMIALQEKYEKLGFTFIGVAYRDNEKALPDFIWEHNINYPVVIADSHILNNFGTHLPEGVTSVPLLFAVNRRGELIAVQVGYKSKDAFEQLIRATLK